MESVEDRTIKPSRLPLFPQTLEIAKGGDFTHSHPPHDGYYVYTDISNGRTTLTFLMGSNTGCRRKVEVSGSCKVEMSRLPF
jgi:hypothetical protein